MAGALFGGKKLATTPVATALRVQTALQGRPISIGCGQTRSAGNLIWYGDFQAIPAKSAGGGKGGIGSGGKGASGNYNYSVSGLVSLGQGPVAQVLTIFNGNAVDFLYTPSPAIVAALAEQGVVPTYGDSTYGAAFVAGYYPQSPWSYLLPPYNLPYPGQILAGFANLQLGSSPSFPSFTFELQWLLNNSVPSFGPDVEPSQWIKLFLTNADYGVRGFSASLIGDWSAFATCNIANSLLISDVLADSKAANSYLQDLMTGLCAEFFWSNGKLQITPYCDQVTTGNGVTFTPNARPVYDLTDDDFVAYQGSLGNASSNTVIAVSRKDPTTILNNVRLEYVDRSTLYNPVLVETKDEAAIDWTGVERPSDLRSQHYFCDARAASVSGHLQLARERVAVQYGFTAKSRYIVLDPMDIVTLTHYPANLYRQPVRIKKMTENNDGTITFLVEEFLGTVGAPLYGRQASRGAGFNANQDPGLVNAPILFEPPDQLGDGLVIWAAVSGQNPAVWGGANIWVSSDNATYQNVGTVESPARMGVLSASLAAVTPSPTGGQTIDSANTLAVDLSESDGELISGTPADLTALNTACYVDGEIIAFQNATLTAANKYNLKTLVRGAYGTPISAHAAGSQFARLDTLVTAIPFTQDRIGATIYIKFQSFNIWGGGLQALNNVGAVPYKITGSALASALPNVGNVRTAYTAGVQQIWWDEITDFRSGILYEVRKGTTFAGSTVVATQAHPPCAAFGNGNYWIRAVAQPTSGLMVYSATPTEEIISGATISQNVVATTDEQATGWAGTFTGGAGISSPFIRLLGTGNILTDANILTTADIIGYGSLSLSGTYVIPTGNIIDVGYAAACQVQVNWNQAAVPLNQNILTDPNILAETDILGAANIAFIDVHPEIQIDPGTGTFGAWQKYVPGVYVGRRFNFRMVLASVDPNTIAECLAFSYSLTVPARVDHYLAQSVPSGGLTITFQPDGAASAGAFNGGPNAGSVPAMSFNWQATAGDTYAISALSKSAVTFKIMNGGVGVARTVDVIAQGY